MSNIAQIKEPFNREKQFSAKRKAVIRAAGQAFRRRGYHNTSLTEIAQSLGLTKAALYYYVKSKQEILFECHMMAYSAMDQLITEHGAASQSGLETLSDLYGGFARLLTRDGLALLTDVDSLSGQYKDDILAWRGHIERAVTKIVERGMTDGSIKAAEPRVTVFFFMGALNWLNMWYEANGRVSGDEIAAQFVAQMRSGIANSP